VVKPRRDGVVMNQAFFVTGTIPKLRKTTIVAGLLHAG
jgi:hypothetical protein